MLATVAAFTIEDKLFTFNNLNLLGVVYLVSVYLFTDERKRRIQIANESKKYLYLLFSWLIVV